MPRCISCGTRYQLTKYNQTSKCEDCIDADLYFDNKDYDVDVELLVNPTGKTKPVFYDDRDYED